MALPLTSSPPLLPTEPPSSPPLFPVWDRTASLPRKRGLSEYDNSSDPLFSDDTSGAEDVTTYQRCKRVESMLAEGSKMRRLNMSDRVQDATIERAQQTAETLARSIIDHCVEDGIEAVDLSDIGLTELSSSTLRPLHQLIRQSHIDITQPPSETEFMPLTPSVKLFLAKNFLTSLPTELFRLENLTVLSLRSNQLTEISPCIARLRKLKELNISGNQIRCLPWELLDLLRCHDRHATVNIRPNPLLEPAQISGPSGLAKLDMVSVAKEELSRFGDTRAYCERLRTICLEKGALDLRTELEIRLKLGRMLRNQSVQESAQAGAEPSVCREDLIYLASSAVRYLDIDGTPASKRDASVDCTARVCDLQDHPRVMNAVPSLFELATRATQAFFSLDDIPAELPVRVRTALQQAAAGLEIGNQQCTMCSRTFVIARAEWVEYWFSGFPSQPELSQETVFPFSRKACSWRCASPSRMGTFRC
ncbi:Glucose-repressible alcohol dehydrogenase transcriptional effector [Pseudocercospora fuligena]|uniref:Glucose-repressible alcohol dehydrogenase transcriptional effector n=1 Tax=Pseudocercospora fuligena TaxID=685502 RepID=A0A8H6RRH7_9PEZI|nr:Glucose-repressible alcohol dehydrogenase transcriptional effector [Pseudocercospora fuligena]